MYNQKYGDKDDKIDKKLKHFQRCIAKINENKKQKEDNKKKVKNDSKSKDKKDKKSKKDKRENSLEKTEKDFKEKKKRSSSPKFQEEVKKHRKNKKDDISEKELTESIYDEPEETETEVIAKLKKITKLSKKLKSSTLTTEHDLFCKLKKVVLQRMK